jgi:hypothetical protein
VEPECRNVHSGNLWTLKPPRRSPTHDENPGQQILRIVGSVLIAAGFAGGVGSALFQLLRFLAHDWWWMAIAVCLLFRTQPVRRFTQAAGLLMLLIWLHFSIADLPDLAGRITYQIHGHCLGFMLTILGALLVVTNDPQRRLARCFRRWLSITGARRKAALAVCVVSLWIVNPAHSHSLCLGAADVCERVGANHAAITFTRLARHTFPAESFCGTCRYEIRQDLTWRIARLRAQPPVAEAGSEQTSEPAFRSAEQAAE